MMSFARRLSLIITSTLLLMVGFGLVLVTPASAAISDCQANEVCTFDGINYGNPHYDYNSTTRGCRNIGPEWNDRISSIVNNSPRQIWPFSNSNCWNGGGEVLDGLDAGTPWTAGPRQHWANIISSIDFG